jgi:predicted nucleotidyltransferase
MNIIAKRLLGSRAYGTDTPTSDFDYRGVFIASLDTYFGIEQRPTGGKDPDQEDTSYWELTAFMKLLYNGNPTACEMIFADTPLEVETSAWWSIRRIRHLFVTQKLARNLQMYARSMLHKGDKSTPKDKMQAARIVYMLGDLAHEKELRVRRTPEQVAHLLSIREEGDVQKLGGQHLTHLLLYQSFDHLPEDVPRDKVNETMRSILQDALFDQYGYPSSC